MSAATPGRLPSIALNRFRPWPFAAMLLLALAARVHAGESDTDFFVVWGRGGEWSGDVSIENGEFTRAEPYLFLGSGDRVLETGPHRVTWQTTNQGGASGLHLFVSRAQDATLCFTSSHGSHEVRVSALPADGPLVVPIAGSRDFLVFGRGDPGVGPPSSARKSIGTVFVPPTPHDVVKVPAPAADARDSLVISLSASPIRPLAVRRSGQNDGLVYIELYIPDQPLAGEATVEAGGRAVGKVKLAGSLWLALPPRLGRVAIAVRSPGGTQQLSAPTTLVETRGAALWLDGEPFLIKGTLPGRITPEDAEYIRSLGMNTVRVHDVAEYAERFGLMAIAAIQGGGLKKLSAYDQADGARALAADVPVFLEAETANGRAAGDNPYILMIQLDNERTTAGGNPLDRKGGGADPWCDFVAGPQSEFSRLDALLARDWNAVKPLNPMVPLGYANESQGYIAPAFLDVVMHNTYLAEDRYGVPLATFKRWQGGDRRPFVNTEYGANRYTPEAYHGAKNSPVLEKIQAWGYRQTWAAFMAARTMGGTGYRLYDGAPGEQRDQGTANFGIMTFDHRPKLACWELWHLWRDFEVAPAPAGPRSLRVVYKRDYWARNCRLTISEEGREWSTPLPDIAPHGERTVELPFAPQNFHWRLDFTTHGGLAMIAGGANPQALEETDFVARLRGRDTFEFLQPLLTAEVLTVAGAPAPATFAAMKRPDDVVPFAFRCADGVVYVTAFSRAKPGGDHYVTTDISLAFLGNVTPVDEWTGRPTAQHIEWDQTPTGITLKNVKVPLIPGPIGLRSDEPLALPVFRITPFKHASSAVPPRS